jgi:hypothetical protein
MRRVMAGSTRNERHHFARSERPQLISVPCRQRGEIVVNPVGSAIGQDYDMCSRRRRLGCELDVAASWIFDGQGNKLAHSPLSEGRLQLADPVVEVDDPVAEQPEDHHDHRSRSDGSVAPYGSALAPLEGEQRDRLVGWWKAKLAGYAVPGPHRSAHAGVAQQGRHVPQRLELGAAAWAVGEMALQHAYLIGRERIERVDGEQFRELGMVHGIH